MMSGNDLFVEYWRSHLIQIVRPSRRGDDLRQFATTIEPEHYTLEPSGVARITKHGPRDKPASI